MYIGAGRDNVQWVRRLRRAVGCAADELHHRDAGEERGSGPDASGAQQAGSHVHQRQTARPALFLHRPRQLHLELYDEHVAPSSPNVCCFCCIFFVVRRRSFLFK